MASTILTYLKKTKNTTLNDVPFNEVDSLILSQFSYLKFDGYVPCIGSRDETVTLRDIANNPFFDLLFSDERYSKNNRALFDGMLQSSRFNQIRLHSYISIIDTDRETQFSAITIEFPNGTVYVAFRGTDESLVGWKEDMNMALSRPVPGQLRSVEYLNTVAAYITGKFMVGGHSKGGNLAVYSAMFTTDAIRERITDIYNHDGPGFRNEILDGESYKIIRDRIKMTVPESSLVGMLLINHDNYRIIDSKNPKIGILQHDPFSWKVKGYEFVQKDSIRDNSALLDRSINETVMNLDEEQIERFMDAAYELMLATGVDDLNELIAEKTKVIRRVAEAMKDMEQETKDLMTMVIGALFDLAGSYKKDEINADIADIKETLKDLDKKIQKIAKKEFDIFENKR